MKKHVKIWMNDRGVGEQDNPLCEYCLSKLIVDIHHILYKSQGGKDELDNLIGLCRDCHDKAHFKIKGKNITKDQLYEKLRKRI